MKVKLVTMRHQGVALPRRAVSDRGAASQVGHLVIFEASEPGRRAFVQVARLLGLGDKQIKAELIEPRIVWSNDWRMVLTGLERGKNDKGQEVAYAQSWHCTIERADRLFNRDEPTNQAQRSNGLAF
ncbi:MAG: hypothetical protein V4754_16205 [Pseudomonadota bacterium]